MLCWVALAISQFARLDHWGWMVCTVFNGVPQWRSSVLGGLRALTPEPLAHRTEERPCRTPFKTARPLRRKCCARPAPPIRLAPRGTPLSSSLLRRPVHTAVGPSTRCGPSTILLGGFRTLLVHHISTLFYARSVGIGCRWHHVHLHTMTYARTTHFTKIVQRRSTTENMYRGSLLIRNCTPTGPYRRPIFRSHRWCKGGGAPYEA